MQDWQAIVEMRESVVPRRTVRSLDAYVVDDVCPNGHSWRTIGSFVGSEHADAAALADLVKRWAVSGGEPCKTCGAPREKGRPIEGLAATWLPTLGRDLLVRVKGDEPVQVALLVAGGAVEPAVLEDPRLGEVWAASAVRGIVGGQGVLDGAPTGPQTESALWAVLSKRPEYAPALVAIAAEKKRAGDLDGALMLLDRAIRNDPRSADAWFHAGDVLDEVGQDDRALQAYQQSIALDPKRVEAFHQAGIVLRRLGRAADAENAYGHALALEPHHASTLHSLAILYRDTGPRHAVANALSAARPSDMTAQMREGAAHMLGEVGTAYAQEGAWQPARQIFERACLFQPGDARYWFNRAVALLQLGAVSDARAKAARAARLDPTYERAVKLAKDLENAQTPATKAGSRVPYAFQYVDSRGDPATMLDFIVKIDGTTAFLESEVARLALDRDKDLLKLLVAKGHNARLRKPGEPKKSGLLGLLKRAPAERPDAEETRPFRFVVAQEPDPEFVRFAEAPRWTTAAGKEIESALVEIVLDEGGKERLLTRTGATGTFRLARKLPVDMEREPERFFPPEFAEYD